MTQHLQRHHHFLSKYNAWKIFEELSSIKQERMNNRKRKNTFTEGENPKKQLKMTDVTKFSRDDPRQTKITNSIASMVCADGIPTNIVNRPGFQNVIATTEPRYKLPHYTTFSRSIIPKLKITVTSFQRKKIEKAIQEENSIGFTLDGLDCRDEQKSAVYSFTLYFYDSDNVCCETVVVEGLEPPVTGVVIRDFIVECLKRFGILDAQDRPKTTLWGISDEGSNLVRAFKLLKQEKIISGYHFFFNHNIQNIIKDAIRTTPGMQKSIQAFRQNAAILSRSKKERQAFRKACEANQIPACIPPCNNETRWFGELTMLETFLKVEEGMKFHAVKSENVVPLSAADWKNAKGYVEILKPFHRATKIEEGEKYVTLSTVIPVLSILHDLTSGYAKDRTHNGYGVGFAKNILASLEDKFGKFPNFMLMRPHCLATFTDPRFSWVYSSQRRGIEPVREEVQNLMRDEMAVHDQVTNAEPSVPLENRETSDSFWDMLDRQRENNHDQNASNIERELSNWSGISGPSRNSNPLHAMAGLKREFPLINHVFSENIQSFPPPKMQMNVYFLSLGG